jgi:subtilisin family serine protease
MRRIISKYIDPLPEKPANADKSTGNVRIAVIDTGVQHPDDYDFPPDNIFGSRGQGPFLRIKNKCSFYGQEKSDWGDKHGHGTHVARILLTYAPRADIFVAKFSNTKELAADNVAQLHDVSIFIGWSLIAL